ncbi:MAG: sigma-54-dependent Fis family transcriptional regulator [Gemmatimonadales bacterium]|nr:MAG: sigma-54-dependent Fis family transcriptional regulator [Gemmatimonadales bacterium]
MTIAAQPRLLVVDDADLIRTCLGHALAASGYTVETAATCAEALRAVEATNPGIVVLDLRLPDGSGIDLLPKLHAIDPDLVVVMVTAFGEISTAVEAVKAGAHDFLEKPIELDTLRLVISRALETRQLREQIAALREQHRWRFANVEIIGRSERMQEVMSMVEKVADAESTVLIEGESGTGKELVAKAIHARSYRRDNPFVEINCTALPENLVESELFGHERGAFTDARERKKGMVELAHTGTLFLDELGDMPLGTQAKLLRFLEDAYIRRVGGTKDIPVDVRVVVATHRDLEHMVELGTFRSDLYFRLNVFPILIPPLRERPEDIAPLASYFVDKLWRDMRRTRPVTLEESAITALEGYDWPGNVRQLKNLLERVMIIEETSEIKAEHLPRDLGRTRMSHAEGDRLMVLPTEGVRLEDVERALIEQALHRTAGNVTAAAAMLGLTRDTLRYRLDRHGLDKVRRPPG